MRTRIIFHDERFLYFGQVLLLKDGRCAVQGLMRIAVVENMKLVSPEYAAKAVKWGFDLVTVNSDVKLLSEMANHVVKKTRNLF